MEHQIKLWKRIKAYLSHTGHPSGIRENKKSYSRISNLLSAGCAIAALSFLLPSCSQENTGPHFETSGEAATAYRHHLSEVQKTESMGMEDLASSVALWQELRDSVSAAFGRDTLRRAHGCSKEALIAVHRSIAAEYQRLALANPRTYKDVLYLKEHGTPFKQRRELQIQSQLLQPFFASLDTIPLYKDSPKQALARYDRFLSATLEQGIADKSQFLDYLRNEDVLFRSYLTHLPGLAGTSMSSITDKTERCCFMAMHPAGKPFFTAGETVRYLTMRTNRRLLQNAEACMEAVNGGRTDSPEQAQAYLWMLMQPFMVLDGNSISMLTQDQKEALYGVADNMPAAIGRLCTVLGYDKERLDGMPALLLKTYLATL